MTLFLTPHTESTEEWGWLKVMGNMEDFQVKSLWCDLDSPEIIAVGIWGNHLGKYLYVL